MQLALQILSTEALLSKDKVLGRPRRCSPPGMSLEVVPSNCLHLLEAQPRACVCTHCHQRQPHLGAKLQNASSWPTSPRLMTAYTRTSLSQDDPNAYFTSTCCRAPFLPTSMSSCLPHPSLLPTPHPSQLFSFFFFCHTYHILVSIPRVALQARVPNISAISRLFLELQLSQLSCHSNSKLFHN